MVNTGGRIVHRIQLRGTFSSSIATMLINVFLNPFARQEREANPFVLLTGVSEAVYTIARFACH